MTTQTYTFKNLPKTILKNINGAQFKFASDVYKNLVSEFEDSLITPIFADARVSDSDLLVTIAVDEADQAYMPIVMNNLYGASILK